MYTFPYKKYVFSVTGSVFHFSFYLFTVYLRHVMEHSPGTQCIQIEPIEARVGNTGQKSVIYILIYNRLQGSN